MHRRYLDPEGLVHEVRRPRMTILLCEEKDGHHNFGQLISDAEDPAVQITTCLQCLAVATQPGVHRSGG